MALVLLGGATGVIDVAMNVQGAAVERRYARPIMTTFHAFYSLGGLAGAVVAGAVASVGIAPAPHLVGTGLLFAGITVAVVWRWLIPDRLDQVSGGPSFARPSRALTRLAIIAFCVVLAEGAIGDWSAVYLRQTLAMSAGLAAGGYAAFSLTMTAGRLAGGWLTSALGARSVVRLGGTLVAVGLGTAMLASGPFVAMTGFACVGLGLSCSFPVTITAASRIPGLSPGAAIAAVNTAGYTGFLAGPPLIGFLADSAGLRAGLGTLALVGLVMLTLSGAVGQRDADEHRPAQPRPAVA